MGDDVDVVMLVVRVVYFQSRERGNVLGMRGRVWRGQGV